MSSAPRAGWDLRSRRCHVRIGVKPSGWIPKLTWHGLEALLRQQVIENLMASGVTIIDPHTTYVHPQVKIGCDTVLHPNTHILGQTVIGEDC